MKHSRSAYIVVQHFKSNTVIIANFRLLEGQFISIFWGHVTRSPISQACSLACLHLWCTFGWVCFSGFPLFIWGLSL